MSRNYDIYCKIIFQQGRKSADNIKSLLLNMDEEEEDKPEMPIMAGVSIEVATPVTAYRVRERMAIEKTEFIVANDYQNFLVLMHEFQKFHDRSKVDMQTPFPEAQLLHRFGSPGAQGSWWHVYNW